MVVLPFIKASACGNDFLLIEADKASGDLAQITRRICNRHEGVGADGVEWLFPDPQTDVRIRLINSDGSDAEISGNGTRCVAAHFAYKKEKKSIAIRTDAGVKTCNLISREGQVFDFETAMGEPHLGEPFTLKLTFGEATGVPVLTGNPHFVWFVDRFVAGWQAEAAEIGAHHDFQHGTNVELGRVPGPHAIEVRFFERGAGETMSSGTGSCASAVAAIGTGRVKSPVNVHAEGGTQVVRWEKEVFLRGSAQVLCRGEFYL